MENLRLKKIVIEVVDNQLQANNPPITKTTYERLQALNYTKQEAKERIAAVVLEEMYDVLKDKKPYDERRYTERLESLK
jgi:hypothetical protein